MNALNLTPYETREAWLHAVARRIEIDLFAPAGYAVPERVRIATAFPSTGRKGNRIGECWDSTCSADGVFEIMIRPDIAEPMDVAATLAHELIHAAVGLKAGHGPVFKKCALAIHLEGKMTATTASAKFRELVAPILEAIGPMPHGKLTWGGLSSAPPKQKARMIKCECPECGYVVRTAQKWLDDVGAPICPADRVQMVCE